MSAAALGRLPPSASPRDQGSAPSPQAVSAIRQVPAGAGALVTPYGKACRLRDAKQAVKDRFYAQYQKLLADMEAELREIDRRFWAGESF